MQTKKIGLVLAGGGGRGAYQIGVWKALRETGLDQYIASVSGTSVGGLNAALFIKNDLDEAQRVWKSISKRVILTPKIDSRYKPPRLSLFERDGLEKLIDDCLGDMSCFDNSDYSCWMACRCDDKVWSQSEEVEVPHTMLDGTKVTCKYGAKGVEYFNLKHIKDNRIRKKIILATSAMRVIFPKETIGGQRYFDGGSRDNVPVKPLYEIDKCNRILVVHLTDMDEPVKRENFPKATLFEIFPKTASKITDVLDFTAEGAERRINQGYEDNLELFERIREIIILDKDPQDVLKDLYERELLYKDIMDELHTDIIDDMEKYIRKEDEEKLWIKRMMS